MKTIIDWFIDKIRRRRNTNLRLKDGQVVIRQGLQIVRLSHSEYLQLVQLKGWQE